MIEFTTTGEMGPECQKLNKRLAEKISNKRKESYPYVITHLRRRLRFALLKATLVVVRGFRGKTPSQEEEIVDISFNLIPQGKVD